MAVKDAQSNKKTGPQGKNQPVMSDKKNNDVRIDRDLRPQ